MSLPLPRHDERHDAGGQLAACSMFGDDLHLTCADGVVVEASPGCEVLLSAMALDRPVGSRVERVLDAGIERPPDGAGAMPWKGTLRMAPEEETTLEGTLRAVEWEGRPAVRVEVEAVSDPGAVLGGLLRNAAQLDLAVHSAGGGTWDLPLDPRRSGELPDHCRISDSLKELLGYAPDEFPDSISAFRGRIHPEDQPAMDRAIADHLGGRTDQHQMEYRVQHRDGSWLWLRSAGRVVPPRDGLRGRWIGVELNVTERRRREEAVRRSEKKYTTLFRLTPDPLALISWRQGCFVEVNGALLRQLGRRRRGLVGRTDLDLDLWPDRGQRRRLIRQLWKTGRVDHMRVALRNGAGEDRIVEVSAERLALNGERYVLVAGRDVTSQQAATERLVDQAYSDPLTGLPNRTLAEEQLDRALEAAGQDGTRTAVLFIDLDGLKRINDSLGHMAGDRLLIAAAERFRSVLRPSDFLARFGGDEMVAVIQVERVATAMEVAERLLGSLHREVVIAGNTLRPTASIGVAVADEDAVEDPRDLLRYADVAMYRAKERAGNCAELFDSHLDAPEIRELELESDLGTAMERGELRLVYQPIVRLHDLALRGAEALLRWDHPDHGAVQPVRFIPIAERSGLIRPLGRWVLERACRQLAVWRRNGVVDDGFVISVNVSAHQLADRRFVDQTAAVLRDTALRPENLELELTEQVAVRRPEEVWELERLGLRIAVDDFGQGYGSLAYLRTLPVDTLKLDRQFTRDLAVDPVDLSLVRTVVYLADNLGLDLVVEGVETAEQLRSLREMGCSLGQGYLFAEPLRPGELAEAAATPGPGLRLIKDGYGADSSFSTRPMSSDVEKGLDRNGTSAPTEPRALSASSR